MWDFDDKQQSLILVLPFGQSTFLLIRDRCHMLFGGHCAKPELLTHKGLKFAVLKRAVLKFKHRNLCGHRSHPNVDLSRKMTGRVGANRSMRRRSKLPPGSQTEPQLPPLSQIQRCAAKIERCVTSATIINHRFRRQ